jgi:hypothetical protein
MGFGAPARAYMLWGWMDMQVPAWGPTCGATSRGVGGTKSAVGRHGGCSSSLVPSLPTLPGDRPHRIRHLSRSPLREVQEHAAPDALSDLPSGDDRLALRQRVLHLVRSFPEPLFVGLIGDVLLKHRLQDLPHPRPLVKRLHRSSLPSLPPTPTYCAAYTNVPSAVPTSRLYGPLRDADSSRCPRGLNLPNAIR